MVKFALIVLAFILSSSAFSARVVLDGIFAGVGAMEKEVISIQERKFLNVVRQKTDFSCGAASLATLLRFTLWLPH